MQMGLDSESNCKANLSETISKKSKHIKGRDQYMRQKVQEKDIESFHAPRVKNTSDILTHPLKQHEFRARCLGLHVEETSLVRSNVNGQ